MVREATIFDWPDIVRAHAEQNDRDGTNYPLAPMFDSHGERVPEVHLILVRTRPDGSFGGCVYYEACAEMMFAGGGAEDTAELASHINGAEYILRQRGVRNLHCLVPKMHLPETKRGGPIARLLRKAGLTRDDNRLGHFFKNL